MPDKHSHGREPESSFSPQAFPIIRPRAQAASITGPAVHHEMCIRDRFRRAAPLHNPPLIQYQNLICLLDGFHPVCDHNQSFPGGQGLSLIHIY